MGLWSITEASDSAFTFTPGALAAAAGRSTASLTNSSDYPAALVSVSVQTNSTPITANGTVDVYLLRDIGTHADDDWGGTDAGYTARNATPLGSIVCTEAAQTTYTKVFDTWPAGPLGPTWGIGIMNRTSQALTTGGTARYVYYQPSYT